MSIISYGAQEGNMIEAGSIMSKDVVRTSADTDIYEAMNLLVEKRLSGLPVTDGEMNLVGMITEKDVLRLLIDKGVTHRNKVGDYMTKSVISFEPEDDVVDIAKFFMERPFRRVPVVKDGKLVGVICRRDIISLILSVSAPFVKANYGVEYDKSKNNILSDYGKPYWSNQSKGVEVWYYAQPHEMFVYFKGDKVIGIDDLRSKKQGGDSE